VRGVEERRILELRLASEAFLFAAVAVVVATDAVGRTGGSTWSFAATNVVIGLLGWFRPIVAGWLFVVLSGVVTASMLFSDAYLDVSSMLVFVGIVVLRATPPLVIGALFLAAGRAARRSESGVGAAKVYWHSSGGAAAFYTIATFAAIECYALLGMLLGDLLD